MRRGTTPTIKIFTSIDLTDAPRVIVTIESGDYLLNLEKDRLEVTHESVSFTLTQEETLNMDYNGRMQVKAHIGDGLVTASDVMIMHFGAILNEEVIEIG